MQIIVIEPIELVRLSAKLVLILAECATRQLWNRRRCRRLFRRLFQHSWRHQSQHSEHLCRLCRHRRRPCERRPRRPAQLQHQSPRVRTARYQRIGDVEVLHALVNECKPSVSAHTGPLLKSRQHASQHVVCAGKLSWNWKIMENLRFGDGVLQNLSSSQCHEQ